MKTLIMLIVIIVITIKALLGLIENAVEVQESSITKSEQVISQIE